MTLNITTADNPFVVGEKQPPFEYQFKDYAGAPINLLNYAARASFRERWAAVATVDGRAAAVTDSANGKVTYTWQGDEYPTPGQWLGELWVGNGTQRYCSLLFTFLVRAPVASVPSI